jgi:hypothetical protein
MKNISTESKIRGDSDWKAEQSFFSIGHHYILIEILIFIEDDSGHIVGSLEPENICWNEYFSLLNIDIGFGEG